MRCRKFPIIETTDDVLPAVAGRDEFVVAERDWGTVIDYQVLLPDTFPCPVQEAHNLKEQQNAMIRRECRGIKFGPDGKIIARPYHKFFNLGERPETQDRELSDTGRFHDDFVILPKLDGSMIHPIPYNSGGVMLCTRMGVSDVAKQAFLFAGNTGWYMDFCYDLMQRGITPIFEWCSRKQRIVIDYPEDMLTLTAIRLNKTGEYLTRGKMRALAEPYKIPLVELFDGSWDGIETFSKTVTSMVDAEGYVIRWDDGNMVKMKGEWYLQIHKAKDAIAFEKNIIELIVDDNIDDVLPHLLPQDYERILEYREDFWAKIKENAEAIQSVVEVAKEFTCATGMKEREAKKFFALNTVTNYTGPMLIFKGILFSVWDSMPARDAILQTIRKNIGSQTKVLGMACLLPNKRWEEY